MCVRVMCVTWLYLHDYHLYERTSACNLQLYDCYQNAVNDRLLLMIWPICMIIICMDAHQRVITDCNQCECLAISVYVWQCRVLSMLCMLLHTKQILLFFFFFFFFFITQIILIVFLVLK